MEFCSVSFHALLFFVHVAFITCGEGEAKNVLESRLLTVVNNERKFLS